MFLQLVISHPLLRSIIGLILVCHFYEVICLIIQILLSQKDFIKFKYIPGVRKISFEKILSPLRFYSNRYKYLKLDQPNGLIFHLETLFKLAPATNLESKEFKKSLLIYKGDQELKPLDKSDNKYRVWIELHKKVLSQTFRILLGTNLTDLEKFFREKSADTPYREILPAFRWLDYSICFPKCIISHSSLVGKESESASLFKINFPITKFSKLEFYIISNQLWNFLKEKKGDLYDPYHT